ncbi:MAG: hypothetical protein KOO69_06290 [Victivallales bacterium]|nr:hypothetical protein [Victivallales bacterium]
MSNSRRYFTVLELLVSITIIAIIAALLLPGLSESQKRARFVRWLHVNKQCSADPACVVNLNFQEGEGGSLTNSAKGHAAEGFDASDYSGVIKGDFEWGQGRWMKSKKALQLDGESTYIEFPNNKFLDFAGENDFTVMISIKFDTLTKWDGIFGKCYMRNSASGFPQYALYFDDANGDNNSTKLFQIDIGTTSVLFSREDENGNEIKNIDDSAWTHLVMRNKIVGGNQVVDLFINGIKLKSTYKNNGPGKKEREQANLAIGCIRWQSNGNNGSSYFNSIYPNIAYSAAKSSYTSYTDISYIANSNDYINCSNETSGTVDDNGGEGNGNNGQSEVNNDQNGDGPGNNGKGGGNDKDNSNDNTDTDNSSTVDDNGGEGNGNNGQSEVNNDQNGDGPGNNGQGGGNNNNNNNDNDNENHN